MNGHSTSKSRFRNLPPKLDVPLQGDTESVEVDLLELSDDPTELCGLLEQERTPHIYWITIAISYVRQGDTDHGIEMLIKGLACQHIQMSSRESIPMQSCLLWLYLQKAREAMKASYTPGEHPEIKTKDQYLQDATVLLNSLGRHDPEHPTYLMGRAVYSTLKAAITVSKQERQTNWDLAAKLYDDSLKKSGNSNMFALMGRAKTLYQKKKYDKALEVYQDVLMRKPDMVPDPRVGIGLCFWQLGYKDDAKIAWERVLEIDPESKFANILLGVYHLNITSALSEDHPDFSFNYKTAMTQFVQRAYKKDKNLPMACTMFASYFFSAGNWTNVEMLCKKAIEYSDVGQVTSDAFYLLGRKHQQCGELDLARQCYVKAESAREDSTYLPARIGTGQISILNKDFGGARFIFENLHKQYPKCLEAMTVLGTLISETYFAGDGEDEKALDEKRRAKTLLELVQASWKDSSKHMAPNVALLLTLARLYEQFEPVKSLACLQQVADMEKENADEEEAMLTPQLLNNMAVFQYECSNFDAARQLLQTALMNCAVMGQADEALDTDALATTLTYNLARLEEAAGDHAEATKLYEELLSRHSDYLDASLRLAYIALKKGSDEGVKKLEELMKADDSNLELCALYAWYLSHRPRKAHIQLAEDKEQRHYKRTLQGNDKHDRYSLTGMGNLHLAAAREMRRDTNVDKEKRRKVYERAVEFFDKALQLDGRNAYAAMGIAIALVEERKEYKEALTVMQRVKEVVREGSVFVNMGHVLTEVKQYTRAIEAYETAIKDYDGARDPWTLTALARTHLLRGKSEKNLTSLHAALAHANAALKLQPEQPIFQFNVAFIQVSICALLHATPVTKRTAAELITALEDLDAAIAAFTAVAKTKNPPYPAQDIEQRATMGRNTTRRQLKSDLETQEAYEAANAAKIAEAKRIRDEELGRREAEIRRAKEAAEEKARKLAEDRKQMNEQAREWAEKKAREEEEKRGAMERDVSPEYDSDGNEIVRKKRTRKPAGTGEKKSRKSKKRGSDDGDGSASDVSAAGERKTKSAPPKKKRKLTKGGKPVLSKEFITESDEEALDLSDVPKEDDEGDESDLTPVPGSDDEGERQKKGKRERGGKVVVDDEDEDEDMDMGDLPIQAVASTDAVAGGAMDNEDEDDP